MQSLYCTVSGRRFFSGITLAVTLTLFSTFAAAQTASAPGAKPAPAANQLTPQVLGAMLSSAATFHDLVEKMNLSKSLGADEHVQGADGRLHHPLERTAQTIGAGAGAGAAIGAMTHSQNGVLVGALIGGAGGLIVDQILKHREEVAQRAAQEPADANYAPRGFKERDPERSPAN